MKLKFEVDSLDSVPEQFRDAYVKVGDKFQLSADGIPDVAGLKSALDKERTAARDAKTALEALGPNAAQDLANLRKEKEDREVELATKRGEFDRLNAARDLAHKTEREKDATRISELESDLKEERLTNTALAAIGEAKGVPGAPLLLMPEIKRRTRWVESEDDKGKKVFTAEYTRADGTPWVTKDGAATIKDLVGDLKAHETYGRAFEGSVPAGSGAQNSRRVPGSRTGVNPYSTATRNLTEQMRMAVEEPVLAEQLKREAVITK